MLNAKITDQTWISTTTSSNGSTDRSASRGGEHATSKPPDIRQFLVNEMKQI